MIFLRQILIKLRLFRTAAAMKSIVEYMFLKIKYCFRDVHILRPFRPGGDYKSQIGQDFYLEKLGLINSNGGYCVDVGCNRPVYNNNTWYLEVRLGYTVVSIDAIDFSDEWSGLRPNSKFICSLVDEIETTLTFYHVTGSERWEDQVSSLYEASLSMGKTFNAVPVEKQTKPLSVLVDEIPRIDVLFIDVEGHELPVLKSLNWDLQRPGCIVAENNGKFLPRHKLEKYLLNREYRLVARIGLSDDIYVSMK